MNLFKTGYIIAKIDDYSRFSYSAWPLSYIRNDVIAECLTNEADDNWFTVYDMQEIAPDLDYIVRYMQHCREIGLDTVALLAETPDNNFEIHDDIIVSEVYGYDCIGTVYHSFLRTEILFFEERLKQENITLNRFGLFNSVNDVERFMEIRKESIANGTNLESFWEAIPIKLNKIIL